MGNSSMLFLIYGNDTRLGNGDSGLYDVGQAYREKPDAASLSPSLS
jgi:hypothetical protein